MIIQWVKKKKKSMVLGFLRNNWQKKKKSKEWRKLRFGMIRVKAQENEAVKMVDASLT